MKAMTDYKVLCEWSRPCYVSEVKVYRDCDQGIATVSIYLILVDSNLRFELVGLNDFDSLASLLESERVIVSKELGCQREYGSIRIECFDDGSYSEYWCDAYSKST